MNVGTFLFLFVCIAYCMIPANSAGCCSPPPASPRPSRAPTFAPTRLPSPSPTRKPTRSPTQRPTKLPSAIPTRRPSRSPTIAPSEVPTEEPTYMPSQPTSQPSSTPTTVTPRPSHIPSNPPSPIPTCAPTLKPTSIPTITPTRTPTIQPTESPTISYKPTAFPTLIPTPKPSQAPSIGPSANPSRIPTAGPSVAPTRSPSTAVATVVTMSISQVLVNIDAESFSNSSANAEAFQRAVSQNIEGIEEQDVTIQSVIDSISATRRLTRTAYKRYLRETAPTANIAMLAVPQITIEYLIAFVMEELGYDNGTLAVRYAALQLSGAVEDGTFLQSLRAAALLLGADAALLNVTSTSVVLVSSSLSVLRSASPSAQPTAPAHSKAGSAAKFENWNKGVQAIVIIIVVLVFLVLVVVFSKYMQRYSWCSALCSAVEIMLFRLVGRGLHSVYLQNDGGTSNAGSNSRDVETPPSQQSDGTSNIANTLSTTPGTSSSFVWANNTNSTVQLMGAGAPSLSRELQLGAEEAEILEEKPEFCSLLFLSRHSEATEALMLEMETLLYGAMPWLQHEQDDDCHPLTHGIAAEQIPKVKFNPVSRPAMASTPQPIMGISALSALSPPVDDHSADSEEADDDLSFYDCVLPSVAIPPGGVPVISRHCVSTENMIAGIDDLLSRAGLSLIDDQEEKDGERNENTAFNHGQTSSSHKAPAPASYVRTEQAGASAALEYTDMLSALIARSRSLGESAAPLCAGLSVASVVGDQEQEQDHEIESPEIELPVRYARESPEEKTNSSAGSAFHYADALSAMIANSAVATTISDHYQSEPVGAQNNAELVPMVMQTHGEDSPFVSLATTAPLAMETVPNLTEPAISSYAAFEAPLELVLTMEPLPEESPRRRESASAVSPRSADDSELGRLPSPSFSILSGDSYFSVASAVTAVTRAPAGSGVTSHNIDQGLTGNTALHTMAASSAADSNGVADSGAAGGGDADADADADAEVKVLRKVGSRRGASPRSPRENAAAFTKPKSPTKEPE